MQHFSFSNKLQCLPTLKKCVSLELIFCLHGATAPSGQRPSHYRGFTITLEDTTLGRFPVDE